MKKFIGILAAVAAAIFLVFITVFVLAKKKIIFLNKWFVNEENSTIGVDISSYQADVDMQKLKEQGIEFIFIKALQRDAAKRVIVKNWAGLSVII